MAKCCSEFVLKTFLYGNWRAATLENELARIIAADVNGPPATLVAVNKIGADVARLDRDQAVALGLESPEHWDTPNQEIWRGSCAQLEENLTVSVNGSEFQCKRRTMVESFDFWVKALNLESTITSGQAYLPVGEASWSEVVVNQQTLDEIEKLELGCTESASGFLKKYGAWHSFLRAESSGMPGEGVNGFVPAYPWWTRATLIRQVLWLMRILTEDPDSFSTGYMEEHGEGFSIRWPDELRLPPGIEYVSLAPSSESGELVFGWSYLAELINTCAPASRLSRIEYDLESGSLTPKVDALSLFEMIWRLIYEKAFSLKPPVRCRYSKCNRFIVDPKRAHKSTCNSTCRSGYSRELKRGMVVERG